MNVEVKAINCCDAPLSYIGAIAGTCYGKEFEGNARARAIRCFKQGHMSPFEHLSITWRVENMSRSCSHQLVRHRVASYTQESQRYIKYDDFTEELFVIPPSIEEDSVAKERYLLSMKADYNAYQELLEMGFKAEDARYVLPNAFKTNITITMNLREFAHFYKLRADKHAQWEIRNLADQMLDSIYVFTGADKEWMELCELIKSGEAGE